MQFWAHLDAFLFLLIRLLIGCLALLPMQRIWRRIPVAKSSQSFRSSVSFSFRIKEYQTSINVKFAMSSPTPNLTYTDYTVGWICALPKEQTAAMAMLDCQHPSLPNPRGDSNTYFLGSIGRHNVVIGCLPKGTTGTNSAATVATRLVNTYPAVRFGLMVGIGGGVYPKVCLGDVVVSIPSGEYPGVVQWDIGKELEDGFFKRTGSLDRPPEALLTALSALETTHDMEGSRMAEYLETMSKKWPRLRKYTQPPTPPENATDLPRVNPEDDIGVHYGLIASGNSVIKNAELRDFIDQQLDGKVLCFEMEAAGLMNSFRCIVIRGIADYADANKNHDWHEYAAARAAAYAKELLSVVPVQHVVDMPVIKG